jgi:PAS domain S-box-containing protein
VGQTADVEIDDPGARRAVEFLLQATRRRLGMDAAYLSEITQTEQVFLATTGTSADAFGIEPGGRIPLGDTYCQHVLATDASFVIRDTRTEPLVADIDDRGIGAYVGVPVRDPSGRLFGTLCCVHHEAREGLAARDIAVVETLADILGLHLDQLARHRESLEWLAAQVADLTDVMEDRDLQVEVFRHMVDSSLNVMLLLDASSLSVEYANLVAAELVGRDRTELLGRAPWELHTCWDEDALRTRLAELQRDGAQPITYTLPATGGAPSLDVAVQRIPRPGGGAYILWKGHDVDSHQAAAEGLRAALAREQEAMEQLRDLDRTRRAFLNAVSHELRTPLTTVKGVAELLHRGAYAPEDSPALLERLVANANRLDRLLSDLLELNRFAHGRLDLQREPVELADLVRDAVEEVEFGDHPLELQLDPVTIEVAPVKVERIVTNLVLNAVTHTPPTTPITVTLTAGQQGALLAVSDRGDGIPPVERDQIFAPFHQGTTAPAHRPGTGIGLSLVSAFAQLHGGRAWVDDTPGGGATFKVSIPMRSGSS